MSSTRDASVRSKVPEVSTRPPGPKSALPDYVLPERAIWALEQLSPELAKQTHDALTGDSKRADVVSPRHRDDDSQEMTALAVLDAHRALQDYGVVAESIAEMVTVKALDIIALRVADVIWEEVNLWRVLASLRSLYRYIYQKEIPAYMRHRLTFYAGAARRNQWDRVRSPAECIAGAVAAAGLADVMLVAGQELLARTRFRDAALLGVGAEISFRTQELYYCDIDMIRFANKGGVEEAKLFIAAEYCKNRMGRIGVVRDPIALSLLRRLIGERKTGALFCTNEGERASEATIAGALRRTSLMTLGVPISPNLLRRGAARRRTRTTRPRWQGASATSQVAPGEGPRSGTMRSPGHTKVSRCSANPEPAMPGPRGLKHSRWFDRNLSRTFPQTSGSSNRAELRAARFTDAMCNAAVPGAPPALEDGAIGG